jgi:hypothetical protein
MHSNFKYFVSCSLRVLLQSLLRFLFGSIILLSNHAYAQIDSTSDETVNNAEYVKADEVGVPPPVEAGPGGDIKLQRKYRTKITDQFDWHMHFLWESRYVTEGRDNLSGSGLLSASSEFILDEVNFIPWYAYSAGADYSELNLNFIYGIRPTVNTAIYFGYNHIRARLLDERANDNEISLDVVHKLMEQVGVSISIYHSFEANGSFLEAGMKHFAELNKRVHFSLQAMLGVNAEYIPDGHNGLNHFQLRAHASYLAEKQTELYAFVGYNVAINRDSVQYAGDELLGDFFWGGVGISYIF